MHRLLRIMSPLSPPAARDLDWLSFQRQETWLILLNLLVLAALFIVHAALFLTGLGPLGFMLAALACRFLMQVCELALLQLRTRPLPPFAIQLYARLSVYLHLAFGWLLTFSGDLEQRHAVVLFLLPITAAAFRFTFAGALGVAVIAGGQAFFEVWWMHGGAAQATLRVAYFEAGTLTLAYTVAALVVWRLGQQLRDGQRELQAHLAELRRTQSDLVEREKLAVVGRLASALAHEVRNPVAMISSSLMLARDACNPQRQAEMLSITQKELERLEQLTTSFLAFARAPELRQESVELGPALEYVRALSTPLAEKLGLALQCEGPPELRAQADGYQLQQVLLNLLTNALQAADPGSTVRCHASGNDAYARIDVENAGAAIPSEHLDQLFEPFFTTKPGGTGLGLAISRRLIHGMGGDLCLTLNEPGRVVFTLRLPLRSDSCA